MFGSKKRIVVSSVVYNLAGDVTKRPDYMKTLIAGGIMSNSGLSMGNIIEDGYLGGPGINLRSFARWARNQGYSDKLGYVTGNIVSNNLINTDQIASQIDHNPATQTVFIENAYVSSADYSVWADQYMLENHPSLINEEWRSDFDEEENIIRIILPDNTVETFSAVGYDIAHRYLYIYYYVSDNVVVGPIETGPVIDLEPTDPFPPTAGWEEISDISEEIDVSLETKTVVLVTYSDARPDEESTNSVFEDTSYTQIQGEWKRDTPTGSTSYLTEYMFQNQSGSIQSTQTTAVEEEDIGGGVVKTTTTTVTTEYVDISKHYRIDKQETETQKFGQMKVDIYARGTGNSVYDAMFGTEIPVGDFFPFVPIRINNRFVSGSYFADIYPLSKKAIKKSTTGKFDELVKSIGKNPSIGDIDYAYSVYGVSLNVIDNSARRYIYEYFQRIMLSTITYGDEFTQWQIKWWMAHASWTAWVQWVRTDWGDGNSPGPEPIRFPYPPIPQYQVRMASSKRTVLNFDMSIKWNGIEETTGSGEIKPNAKIRDIWVEKGAVLNFPQWIYYSPGGDADVPRWIEATAYAVEEVVLSYQDTKSTWKKVRVWGLEHVNMIYKGRSVNITGHEALNEADESGFIIPLHEEIYRTIPLIDSTQMASACCMLVFNCYEVYRQKWYQSGLFQLLVIVVVIAITIYFPPAGGAAGGGGILGANAAIGAAAGLTGTAAVLAGAAVNAIAAMVVTQMVMAAATTLFGDKLGSIIGSIASFIVVAGATLHQAGQSFSQSLSTMFGNMVQAENLIKLTMSVGNGIAQYIQASAQEIIAETQQLLEQYKLDSGAIMRMYEENIGFGLGVINPLALTESVNREGIATESPDSFLSRTLMTGSDIAEMSHKMLEQFTELTLKPDLGR